MRPILLLHGFSSSSKLNWADTGWISTLQAAGRRVITVDLPGRGRTQLYRFTGDNQGVIPYLGGGMSLAGHADCGSDPGCPALWVNVVFGFELHYRSTFNWILEYHGMDALRRHRLYVGLTTRRGS